MAIPANNRAEIVKKVAVKERTHRINRSIKPLFLYVKNNKFVPNSKTHLFMKRKTELPEKKWTTMSGHSPVADFFNMIHPISDEIFEIIDAETFPVQFPKGKFISKPGNTGDMIYFILKGVVRGFIVEEGKELTTWINEENEIIGTIRNLGLERPSEEHIQALENSQMIGIPYTMVEHLYNAYPESNLIGRKILEDSYRGAEERAYICRIPSAERKYKRFVDTRPNLVNRVSLKYIASYLGMTLETLSRIRNKRSI